ncbi:O-antigen ligase family protein [Patescibacteria group bacterium]|nr:O-antigen ligase family protein [Patescibacteria group bacterium]
MLCLVKLFKSPWEIFLFLVFFTILLIISPDNYLLIIGLILTLPAIYWLSYHLTWGLILIALTFPFVNWQIYLTAALNAPLVDWLSLGLLLAYGLFLVRTKKFRQIKLPLLLPFLAFIIIALLSLSQSFFWQPGIKYIFRPLIFCYLVYFILPVNLITSKKILWKIIWAWYLLTVVCALLSLFAYLFLLFENSEFSRMIPFNLAGFSPLGANQNLLTELVASSLPLGLLLAFAAKARKKISLAFIASLALLSIILLLTFSRSGWLVLLLQIFCFIFLFLPYFPEKELWKKRLKIFFTDFLLLGLIVAAPIILLMGQLMASQAVISSNINRLWQWGIGLEMLKDNLLLGAGPGSFIPILNVDPQYILEFGADLEAHGLPLKLLAETGLLGALAFALFLGLIFGSGWRLLNSLKNRPNNFFIFACLWLSVASLFFFQLFNTTYFTAKFWLPLGILISAINLYGKKSTAKN